MTLRSKFSGTLCEQGQCPVVMCPLRSLHVSHNYVTGKQRNLCANGLEIVHQKYYTSICKLMIIVHVYSIFLEMHVRW